MLEGTGDRETYLHCRRHSVIIEFVACEHRQNSALEWEILSQARQRFLGKDQLSLFIKALMILFLFNVGNDAPQFFLFWLPNLHSKFDHSNVELKERNYLKKSESGANWHLSLNTYVFNSQETQQNAVTHAFSDFLRKRMTPILFVTHFCFSTRI